MHRVMNLPSAPTDVIATSAGLHVLHETLYEYAFPVSLSQQLLQLKPRAFQFQTCSAHEVRVAPSPSEMHSALDFFGNHRQYLSIAQPHDRLVVSAESTIHLAARPGTELLAYSKPWESVRDTLREISRPLNNDPQGLEPVKFLYESPHVLLSEELRNYARPSFSSGQSVLAGALALTHQIHREFTFDPQATDISTPLTDLLRLRRGVCQDFAHLMIGCLRSFGLSCRYVSGYILTNPPPGMPRLVGADASHAWVSVYCPSIGWVDFDPTNRCMVNLEHVTLGWGRDFSDVSPIRGVMMGGGEQSLKVSVTVTPLLSM
jgi:transglutaminase-like putative cysteine protease